MTRQGAIDPPDSRGAIEEFSHNLPQNPDIGGLSLARSGVRKRRRQTNPGPRDQLFPALVRLLNSMPHRRSDSRTCSGEHEKPRRPEAIGIQLLSEKKAAVMTSHNSKLRARRGLRTRIAVLLPLALGLLAPIQLARAGELSTGLEGGNGHDGNMFDLRAHNTVSITSFGTHYERGPLTLRVYTRSTGWFGSENDASAWTLHHSERVMGRGEGELTPLHLSVPIVIKAGEKLAVYITNTGGDDSNAIYSDGEGEVCANADLEFFEGLGNAYPFGSIYSERRWNGSIRYEVRLGRSFCHGDGVSLPCPCSNPGTGSEGCANSMGTGGLLEASGSRSLAADDLTFNASLLIPGRRAILFHADAPWGGQSGFRGDGLLCVGGSLVRLGVATVDLSGMVSLPSRPRLDRTNWWPGETRYFQLWYEDRGLGSCGSGMNFTNALSLTPLP